jgi:hypothetical protein
MECKTKLVNPELTDPERRRLRSTSRTHPLVERLIPQEARKKKTIFIIETALLEMVISPMKTRKEG